MSQIRTNSIVPAGGLAGDGGGIIQIKQTSTDTTTSGAHETWIEVPATVSITPQSTSNKVLVWFQFSVSTTANSNDFTARLKRGGTVIGGSGQAGYSKQGIYGQGIADAKWFAGGFNFSYLDSPATTSAVSYTAEVILGGTTGATVYISRSGDTSGTDSWAVTSRAIAMEVSG